MVGTGSSTHRQAWLTYVLTDLDVPKALTLYFSMKKVFTSRKLAVLTSRNVSPSMKEVLRYVFDFFFVLEEELNTAGLKDEEFVKLSAFTLRCFEKLVFLEPNIIAVKNSDDIFDKYEIPHGFLTSEMGQGENHDGLFIFVARPCLQVFRTLMNSLETRNEADVEKYLRCWAENQQSGTSKTLEKKYYAKLQENSTPFLLNESEISLVKIDIPLDKENTEGFGLFAQSILEQRRKIYGDNVQPLLQAMANGTILDQLGTLSHHQSLGDHKEPIAIVGMSCRYPSANNLEEFWSLLLNGEDGTGNPPEFRWLREQSPRPVADCRKTNAGFLKVPVDNFDAKFFGISPKEMVFLDPQHRLLHELVWEGFEDAAVNPQALRGTNGGVFIGSWTNYYKDILEHGGNNEFYRTYMGNSIGAAAARISFLLGMTGPSIATESGCSSAMVAVHLACRALQNRETGFALACGVNLLLHPFDKDEMPMVISPDGHCKTFDANANGFARAEGCGVLVLKRLSDAVRDEDKIWALIRGSAMSQEGLSKSMGTPTVHCESLAMTQALQDGGVDPAQVSYVEAHGTGTVVGDPMEVAAIAKAYHSKQRKEPLFIGSVKTNVGHTESCSGITGIMKVVLGMHHEIIPPHRNFETLNPAIDLNAVPAIIPLKPEEWKKQIGKPRFAGVSSFGITGTDAHAIIEEPPTRPEKALSTSHFERPLHIMKISAKTDEALDSLLEKYKNFLSGITQNEFKDSAYTANIGRSDFSQRAIVIAKSNGEAAEIIQQNKFQRGEEASDEARGKLCFLFTGQGSQYPGMAKELYRSSPVFRMHFEYCQNFLKNRYKIDIAQVLWSEANSNEISKTIFSQTSIFCVEYALLKLWESWGVKADYALGHSLGEFAAAVCAKVLSVEDALKLVAERSLLIDRLPGGKMLVIKADKQRVDSLMKQFAGDDASKFLDYAAVNSPEQTVVAGDSDVILKFAECCKNANLKCILLEATHAFHSKHMDPMLDEYRNVANTVRNLGHTTADCSYISGVLGTLIGATELNAEYWVQHTREKVSFLDASKKAVELGCKTFIEIGPQPVLSALTLMNNDIPLLCLPSLKRNENDWETLLTTLGKLYVKGLEINWQGIDQFYIRKKVSLPHYPFIGKKFWPDICSATGASIHPLLGSVISNASPSKIFQNGLNLGALDYVKDHAIGEHIIFPGAGYLEMCLAAGLATIEGSSDFLSPPTRPMKVENLCIEAPLCLNDTATTQVQTVAEFNSTNENKSNHNDWNDISIKVFRQACSESSKSWEPHANATFSPLPISSDMEVSFDSNLFLETVKDLPEDETGIEQIYKKLASVGLKFGPTFKSIEKVWKDEKKNTLTAKLKVPDTDSASNHHNQYIIHPVVLDAMIQAVMMRGPISTLKKSLYVPIKIGKFVWLSEASTSELYVHAYQHDKNNLDGGSAVLVDACGNVLAVMSSVQLIDTTVKAIESVLEQQSTFYPQFYEEVWKKTPSTMQLAVDTELAKGRFYTDEFKTEFEDKYNIPSQELAETYKNLETFVYLNFLRSLYELGWKPEVSERFTEAELLDQLGIKKEYRQYFGFLCDVLEAEGILERVDDNQNWTVIRVPPSLDNVLTLLKSPELSSCLIQAFNPTLLLQKVGESLSSLFEGTVSPISVLFPEGNKSYPSLADFYDDYAIFANVMKLLEYNGSKIFGHIANSQINPEFELKILEIGAGTGAVTEGMIGAIVALGIKFEYTYTDISAAFFPGAEKRFEKHLKHIKFKKLNIEEDPLAQGLIPDYFDFVSCGEVLHATRDIGEALRNIRKVMKPYARLNIEETTRVSRLITFLFGTLEGYWRFQDFELRPKYCVMEKQTWARAFQSNGFMFEGSLSVFSDYHSIICGQKTVLDVISPEVSKTWLLFHIPNSPISEFFQAKIPQISGRNIVIVEAGDYFCNDMEHSRFLHRKTEMEDFISMFNALADIKVDIEGIIYCWALDTHEVTQKRILQPYFNLTKCVLSLKSTPRLSLFTRGVVPLEENDLSCFHLSTLWGYTKSMKNENIHFNCRCIEVADGKLDERRMQELFYEVWSSDKENQVAYSGNSRLVPKYVPHKPVSNALKLPKGTDRFQLVLPETKSISDLQFGPLDHINLKENEVEVQIKASALNFRDVLSIIKPSDDFKDVNTVGFDFAGVIKRVGTKVRKWKEGDRVCGCNVHFTAMPSHLTLAEDLFLHLPENMSYCEGATMPAVYITSVLCLVEIAKIKKEDVVLIHTASGGVGLSAIEICKHVGCTIIATAGSKRKQNYLRSVGIKHIFHSRNTQYGDQILELTKGRGVDVVLNSLTSEGFKEATLKVCAKGARFVEMSKLNIWTKEEVKKLRPDVEYTAIDLSQAEKGEWVRLLTSLKSLLEKGVVRPIPYLKFDAQNVREALSYMQKAKHIGKIVCVMPDVRNDGGAIKIQTPMFNYNSTYLITGGLGGIGFVVCKWMVEKGAKHVVLAGRNPPSNPVQTVINELNSKGANVIPVQLDVGNYEQCRQLIQIKLEEIRLPPLKGIMHAAGTLSDGLIINQDWQKLSSTFSTKINGTLNLHELTKHLNLEHFVLFSSIAAVCGSSGQCNHAAGNAFEDAFAHYRNSIGLPATTINWGQWGEVGIAKEVDLPGVKTLSNLQGVIGLEYVMKAQRIQTSINNVSSFVLLSKFIPQLNIYLDESVMKASAATATGVLNVEEFWKQFDSSLELTQKADLLKKTLGIIVCNVLKLDEGETIDYDANLQDLGVDSLMFVEIKNEVQILMGDRLVVNASAIKDCDTINLLGDTLLRLIEGDLEDDSEKPTLEQVAELIREDSILPESISAKKGQQIKNVDEIRTVLLTGSTGTLGPYVLKELTNLPQITEVVCLIRPLKTESVDERLIKTLEGMALNSKINMKKVNCIAGNVAAPHLGMNKESYAELSGKVDAIFHCAASVLHTQHYKKVSSQKDMRAINIGGIKNVLEFACENKLKHVYHASSLLACSTVDETSGRLKESWPEVGEYDNVTTLGYPVSKFVGDVLVKQAAERGIPVKVVRLPLIVGETGTGRCNIENNHALLRYMFIMKTGIMPSNPLPIPLLPVDICAETSIRLFFNENAPIGIYNISHKNPDTDQEFVNIAKRFGYNVDVVDFSEFAKRVQNLGSGGEDSVFSIFKGFYMDENAVLATFSTAPVLRTWIEGSEAETMWMSKKAEEYLPGFYEKHQHGPAMDHIYNDLLFCKKQGWFDKFGLCSD